MRERWDEELLGSHEANESTIQPINGKTSEKSIETHDASTAIAELKKQLNAAGEAQLLGEDKIMEIKDFQNKIKKIEAHENEI